CPRSPRAPRSSASTTTPASVTSRSKVSCQSNEPTTLVVSMKPRILIVEDEPGIADTLQYALRTEGFAPHWCATGQDALADVRARPPALVILDVGLPDASGFEIFRRLRESSDVPVV